MSALVELNQSARNELIQVEEISDVLDDLQRVENFQHKLSEFMPFFSDEALNEVYPLLRRVGDKSFQLRCLYWSIKARRRELKKEVDQYNQWCRQNGFEQDKISVSYARMMSQIYNSVCPQWWDSFDLAEVAMVFSGKKKWTEAKIVRDGYRNGFDDFPNLTNSHFWEVLYVEEEHRREALAQANDARMNPSEFRKFIEQTYKKSRKPKPRLLSDTQNQELSHSATMTYWEYAFTGEPEKDISEAMPSELPDNISEIGFWLGLATQYFNHCIETNQNVALFKVSRLIARALTEFNGELLKDQDIAEAIIVEDNAEDSPDIDIETEAEEEIEDSTEALILAEMQQQKKPKPVQPLPGNEESSG